MTEEKASSASCLIPSSVASRVWSTPQMKDLRLRMTGSSKSDGVINGRRIVYKRCSTIAAAPGFLGARRNAASRVRSISQRNALHLIRRFMPSLSAAELLGVTASPRVVEKSAFQRPFRIDDVLNLIDSCPFQGKNRTKLVEDVVQRWVLGQNIYPCTGIFTQIIQTSFQYSLYT